MTRHPYAIQHVNTGFTTPIGKLPMQPVPAGTLLPFSWVHPDRISVKHHNYVVGHVDRLALELRIPRLILAWFGPTPPGSPVREINFWYRAPFDDFILGGLAGPMKAHPTMPGIGFMQILDGFRGPALVDVLAHEMRHLWQYAQDMPKAERETDAERFADDYWRRVAA